MPSPKPDTPIETLIDRLRNGDAGALAVLYNHHLAQLRRMIELRLHPALNGRVNPSDVLQEAYIDAQQRFHHFFDKPDQSFYVWLRLVVNQSLVAVHRRHLGAKMRSAGVEVSLGGAQQAVSGAMSVSLARELVARMDSPSQVARQAETLEQVQRAIESLDPIDREILTLRHFEELTNDEVAQTLGLAKAAASNRYVRALGRLRDALRDVPGFFED